MAVIADYQKTMPSLCRLFGEFEAIAGMSLNVAKTVFIRLWNNRDNFKGIKLLIHESCSTWRDLAVSDKGKLLSYYIGPGSRASSWAQALAKFQEKAIAWSQLGFGLRYNAMVFNVYLLPLLEFIS